MSLFKEPQIEQMKTDFSSCPQTIRISKLKTATMGKNSMEGFSV